MGVGSTANPLAHSSAVPDGPLTHTNDAVFVSLNRTACGASYREPSDLVMTYLLEHLNYYIAAKHSAEF